MLRVQPPLVNLERGSNERNVTKPKMTGHDPFGNQ
jgi:hypothetical protein